MKSYRGRTMLTMIGALLAPAGAARAADVYEPNDTPADAVPIGAPFSARGLEIADASDADYFRIEGRAFDEVLVRATEADTFLPRVAVTDGAGFFTSPDPRHTPSAVVAVLPADGTYYLRVTADRPNLEGDRGAYALEVRLARGAPDRLEPNDAPATATRIPTPHYEDAEVTIAPAGDVDVFVARGHAGDLVTVAADLVFPIFRTESFQLTPRIAISDAAGNLLGATPYREGQVLLASDGDIYVTISGAPSFRRGPYRLRVDVESRLDPDAYEPNDTLSTATPLVPRPEWYLDASLDRGDLDLFRIDAFAGTELTATASDRFTRPAPRLVLFDAGGTAIPLTSPTTLPADGPYYLGVTSPDDLAFQGATALQHYSLFVRVIGPPRVVEPGHASSFVAPALAAARIAADPTTGDLYALGNSSSWTLSRLHAGALTTTALSPQGAGAYAGSQLAVRRGFGGADLFTADASGRTVAFRAPSGDAGRVLAATSGGPQVGLAWSGGLLYVSSGYLGARAISAVSAAGVIAPFMGADRLSSAPESLSASHDGELLHYANGSSEVVTIDIPTATEVSRVSVGPYDSAAPRIAVEPVSGDVFALVRAPDGYYGLRDVVRYQTASGRVIRFAENLPEATDLTFGPCGDPTAREWCLYVSTARGLMKIQGFSRPFDLIDPVRDVSPRAPDVIGVNTGYADFLAAGSSTHMIVAVELAAPPPARGEVRVSIDHGETPSLGADTQVAARFQPGAVSWRGLADLAAYSRVDGSQVRFAIPISGLRQRATATQRHAGAERILLWVTTFDDRAREADRAPDTGALVARSYFPIVTLMPSRIDFGGVRYGSRALRPLAIANLGIGTLELASIAVHGSAFGLLDLPLQVPESTTAIVQVVCEPTRAGSLSSSVRISSLNPAIVRTVPVTCRGL